MKKIMRVGIITIFPEMFKIISEYGIIGRAVKNNLLKIEIWNPRNFAYDRSRTIDDYPYGGGFGMIMKMKPLQNAITAAKLTLGKDTKVIYLSPQGRQLNQSRASKLAKNNKLILICGRYRGIDERLFLNEIDEEWSIGDYILSGGELPAMVVIDTIVRFLPGVLKHKLSRLSDSFLDGLLDCPHYTRPKVLNGIQVPEILLSGNHSEINLWRLKQSLGQTWLKRPELIKNRNLTKEEKRLLEEFKIEYEKNSNEKRKLIKNN